MMGLSVLLNPHEEKEKISYRLTNGMEVGFSVLYVRNLLQSLKDDLLLIKNKCLMGLCENVII